MKSDLLKSTNEKLSSEMPPGRRKLQTTKTPISLLLINGETSRTCSKTDAVDERDSSDNNQILALAPPLNKVLTEVNMLAAMQDHISCTKLKSSSNCEIVKVDCDKDLTKMTFELDHMYANCSSSAGNNNSGLRLNNLAASLSPATALALDETISDDDAQQIHCLKELLLLHLDLIRQEQEKATQKDKQISELKKENEELKQQLKEVIDKCRRSRGKRGKTSETGEGSDSESGGGCKWREQTNDSIARKHFDRRRKRNQSSKSDLDTADEQNKRRRKSIDDKNNYLNTDIVYYTPVGEVTREEEYHSVQVPGWRLKVITSCYQMEGTENLDDDIYLKRHQKLEIDEKRRKRWDIQRIREQKMQEKLRSGRQKKKSKPTKKSPIKSFYPIIEDVQFIEVCEELPVTAFGRQLSNAEPSEFRLPWMNE